VGVPVGREKIGFSGASRLTEKIVDIILKILFVGHGRFAGKL
jgi:hypothetical protein